MISAIATTTYMLLGLCFAPMSEKPVECSYIIQTIGQDNAEACITERNKRNSTISPIIWTCVKRGGGDVK